MSDHISPQQFDDSDGVDDWRILSDGACAHFPTTSFPTAARFVQAITDLPEADAHRPDIDIRADGVTVRVITVDDGYMGMSQRDVDMARRISAAARALGLTADPAKVQSLLIVPGATSRPEIMPFWRAVLGYDPRQDSPEEDLVDPRGRNVPFWFEQMDEPRKDGLGAIHVAVFVPYELAEGRIKAALAAGGRMVRDEFAPMWWTLADPAGNEADIATAKGRS